MKHVMKSLKHNGIFVPPYDLKGFNVKIQGQTIKLTEKSEPMAMAWSRRVLSTTIPPPDAVFTKNFMKEFLGQLKKENPSSDLFGCVLLKIPVLTLIITQRWLKSTKSTSLKLRTLLFKKKQQKRH